MNSQTSYSKMAAIYDRLMTDAPYEQWVNWIEGQVSYYGNGKQLLDVGCGTGEIAVRLAKKAFNVTGIDLSPDMLAVANAKCDKLEFKQPYFVQQDMRQLHLDEIFDVAVSLCDSLNYLDSQKDLEQTFKKVYHQLKPGGLFLFDCHSTCKIDQFFAGHQFSAVEEDIAYIWDCFAGDEPHSVDHELTFFVENAHGTYDRFDEHHYQRTYSVETYRHLLNKAGFELVEITSDFTNKKPKDDSERLFFTTRKSVNI